MNRANMAMAGVLCAVTALVSTATSGSRRLVSAQAGGSDKPVSVANREQLYGLWSIRYPFSAGAMQDYEFRSDETCSYRFSGSFAREYNISGDDLQLLTNHPNGQPDAMTVHWKARVHGNSLMLQFLTDVPGCAFQRSGAPSDSLVGIWKSETCNIPVSNLRQGMAKILGSNAEYSFAADHTMRGHYELDGSGKYAVQGRTVQVSCMLPFPGTPPSDLSFTIANGQLLLIDKDERSLFVKQTSDRINQYVPNLNSPENNGIAERAIQEYKSALDRNSQDLKSITALGYLYAELHRLEEAKWYYRRAIELDPDNPSFYYVIATIDWAQSTPRRMEEPTKLGLKPGQPLPNTDQCNTLRNRNLGLITEGIGMVEKTLQLHPDLNDAMLFYSLLLGEKADIECGNPGLHDQEQREADKWMRDSLATRTANLQNHRFPQAWIYGSPAAPVLALPMPRAGGGIVTSPVIKESEAPPPPRISVSPGVSQGLLLHQVQPVYPRLARLANIHGAVVLQAHISRDGAIEDLKAISGHPMLVPAAIDAVKEWRYKPYFLNGEPVAVETQITVNFTLSNP